MDEDHVGTGLVKRLAAPKRVVEIGDAPRIRSPDYDEVRIRPRLDGLLDLGDHEFRRHQMFDADMVVETARQ